jgi:F0F1-type ATP synthase alpha subunit
MIDIPPEKVKDFQEKLLGFFHSQHEDIMKNIESTGKLEDDTKDQILKLTDEFARSYEC